jgi:hypothetical protein
MTRAELVDFVCEKVGKTDAYAKARCGKFLAVRYAMLWNVQLWADSLGMVTFNANANPVIMPWQFDRVVEIRSGGVRLNVTDQSTLFAYDPAIFEATGAPMQFVVEALSGTQVAPASTQLAIVSSSNTDNGKGIFIRGIRDDGIFVDETLQLTGNTDQYSAHKYKWIDLISFASTVTGQVSVWEWLSASGTKGNLLLVLRPGETNRLHEVVRLVQTPAEFPYELSVLAKRRPNRLVNDEDATLIPTIDNVLLAYTEGDMYEWLRQLDKAARKKQEAAMLDLPVTYNALRSQRASKPRLLPTFYDGGVSSLD